jgi:enterochelin esterase-like enzyme
MECPTLRLCTLAVVVSLCTTTAIFAQEPVPLVPGLNKECTLGPSEKHLYVINLQEGAAVIGAAVQHGVDLVIDVFGPNGTLIRTVDSPNGDEGPEPIDITAFKQGVYTLAIHTLNGAVTPGKYIMKIDSIITADQNARRLAHQYYPAVLYGLWQEYLTDSSAVERFVADRTGKGPVIENIEGDTKNVKVTYLYYGDENTEKVRTTGGPFAEVGGIIMKRFMKTPLFFTQEKVPNDARYCYRFAAIELRFAGPTGRVQLSEDVFSNDKLNPAVFDGESALTMPAAPPEPYLVKVDSFPHGKIAAATLESVSLKETRKLTIYTPPGYDGEMKCNLLIVFDGEDFDGGVTSTVHIPTMLDNLLAAGKIYPTVAVFVYNNNHHRLQDLTGNPLFADFIGKEIVPWARKNYQIVPGGSHVAASGASLGGLAASHCAFMHSEAVGNVLSLSGSYWITKDWQNRWGWPLTDGSGDLVGEFQRSKRLPITFYIDIGRFENSGDMIGTNRELRDVLRLKGYHVTYHEVEGGHQSISWAASFPNGLIALFGR